MIPIDNSGNRLEILSKTYLDELKAYFRINPASEKKDKLQNLFCNKRSLESRMIKYFSQNLEAIILAKPAELVTVHKKFKDYLKLNDHDAQHRRKFRQFKERMEYYYSDFFSKKMKSSGNETTIGRWLTGMLNLRVCPYCNHSYTLTVNDNVGKINFRPDFDHFYPKSTFPLLALSFFNLIPSCNVCNKLKGNKLVRYSPYLQIKNDVKFELYGFNGRNKTLLGLSDKTDKLIIKPVYLNNAEFSNCNLKTFGIEQVYEHQVDYVQDIIALAQAYNQDHFTEMVDNFKGLGKTEADIDRIIWGAYLEDHSKRPLSKLTHDLLVQLGIK